MRQSIRAGLCARDGCLCTLNMNGKCAHCQCPRNVAFACGSASVQLGEERKDLTRSDIEWTGDTMRWHLGIASGPGEGHHQWK